MDKSLTTFKVQIYKYTLLAAIILEIGALPILGVGVRYVDYSYGLALGTCIAVMSFNILFLVSKKVVTGGKKMWAALGYMIRLPIYGLAFYICIRLSVVCGIACLLGFLTSTLSIIYIHGIKAKPDRSWKVRPEVKEEFERIDRERELHKDDSLLSKIKREINYHDDEKSDASNDE
ncbi:MAG: ATP synthase subunit I [Clostridiales bacterium]|nr:ATP synthase subunit I [Clostridiales bacterium]